MSGKESSMSKLLDYSLEDFIEKTRDTTSYPGGGALASLTASLAGALMVMVNGLSKGQCLEDLKSLEDLIEAAKENIEADAHAFSGVLEAGKLPRETEAQERAYQEALRKGYIRAIEVPLKTCQVALDLLKVQETMVKKASTYGLPDLYVAASLALASLEGASFMVDCNLPFLKDLEKRRAYEEEKKALLDQGRSLKEKILASKERA